jgi:rubrerythrin
MIGELTELLDIAMDREIASQAFYIAGQKKTRDQGAIELMKELAAQELKHLEWIKNFKESGLSSKDWSPKNLSALNISEYLVDANIAEGAWLQDVITAAMKREQHSVEFYSQMMQVMNSETGKRLCERLSSEELNHKNKLEIFYHDYFLKEN